MTKQQGILIGKFKKKSKTKTSRRYRMQSRTCEIKFQSTHHCIWIFFAKSRNCTSDDRQILFLLREIQVFLALKSIHQVNYSAICCNLIDFVFAKESNHIQCEKTKKKSNFRILLTIGWFMFAFCLHPRDEKKECEKLTPNIWLHLITCCVMTPFYFGKLFFIIELQQFDARLAMTCDARR